MAERFDIASVVDAEQLFVTSVPKAEPREASTGFGFGVLETRSDREQPLSPLGVLGRSRVLEEQVVVSKKSRRRG